MGCSGIILDRVSEEVLSGGGDIWEVTQINELVRHLKIWRESLLGRRKCKSTALNSTELGLFENQKEGQHLRR